MTRTDPVRIGLIGAGRIGTHHATTLARRLGEAELVAVADPRGRGRQRLGEPLGVEWLTDAQALIDDPRVEAVAITARAPPTPTSSSPPPRPARPSSSRSRWR